ncbi:G5 domain-containing protein [Candidatus Saccharibacteria bacterium]|nr:G5 domain-containing protein [Candidatus Saccharibacteria bacterium]
MKLARKLDKVMVLMVVATLVLVFGAVVSGLTHTTFAENEDGFYTANEARFVTFYDEGSKLTVRTSAKTVGEALERADITINSGDLVEPALDTEIDIDNFFINIYRARPVIVKDGGVEKYMMTASAEAKTIAKEAGLTIYDGDKIDVAMNSNFLEAGMASIYTITRNGGRQVTMEEEIPFAEEKVKDFNLAPGATEVRQLGEVGRKTVVYEVLYVDGVEVSREFLNEEVVKEPVSRVVAVGASKIEQKPLTAAMGRNRYTVTLDDGSVIERQETYYDLPMSGVMAIAARSCGAQNYYTVREDGVKVDADGYVLVAAHLGRYPRCSVVETSLGPGKVYDTGSFATGNPEQFDLATDWTNRNGN